MRLPLAIVAVSLIAASAHAQDRFGPTNTGSPIDASGATRGEALFNSGRVLTWNSKARAQAAAPALPAPPRYVTVEVPSAGPAPLAGGSLALAAMDPTPAPPQGAPPPVSLAFVTAASQPQPLGAPHPVALAFVNAASQPQPVAAPRPVSLAFVTAASQTSSTPSPAPVSAAFGAAAARPVVSAAVPAGLPASLLGQVAPSPTPPAPVGTPAKLDVPAPPVPAAIAVAQADVAAAPAPAALPTPAAEPPKPARAPRPGAGANPIPLAQY